MSLWNNLIKLYNNTPGICPVAHTYISPSICVLLGQDGKFLTAMASQCNDIAIVPCTWQSETRTSNNAPHLLSDNLSYLTKTPGQEARHEKYISQLCSYLDEEPDDIAALAVYKYMAGGTFEGDIAGLIKDNFPKRQPKGIYVAFAVYGCPEADKKWMDYYTGSLPKNGTCTITGKPDFIPGAYPARTLSSKSMAHLLPSGCGAGYIASQKIIHALQYLCYAKARQSEAEIMEFQMGLGDKGFSEEAVKDIEKELLRWEP